MFWRRTHCCCCPARYFSLVTVMASKGKVEMFVYMLVAELKCSMVVMESERDVEEINNKRWWWGETSCRPSTSAWSLLELQPQPRWLFVLRTSHQTRIALAHSER